MLSSCSTPWLRCDDIRLLFSESMVVRDAAQINPLNCCVHERKNMRLKSMFFIGWIKLYTVMFALQISQLDEIRTISNLITKHFGGSPNPSNHYSSKSPQSFRWFTPNFSSLSPCHIIIFKKKNTNEYVSVHMFLQFINMMSNLFSCLVLNHALTRILDTWPCILCWLTSLLIVSWLMCSVYISKTIDYPLVN